MGRLKRTVGASRKVLGRWVVGKSCFQRQQCPAFILSVISHMRHVCNRHATVKPIAIMEMMGHLQQEIKMIDTPKELFGTHNLWITGQSQIRDQGKVLRNRHEGLRWCDREREMERF